MVRYWDVVDDGESSEGFDSYEKALAYAKQRGEDGWCDVSVYEHRKVATVDRGPIIVTKHKK